MIDREVSATNKTQYVRASEIVEDKPEIRDKGVVQLLRKEKNDPLEIKTLPTHSP